MTTGPDVTATFCATLVDEWVRAGVEHVVVCPGSRSTPLALAVAADGRVALHVHHDERSAGFMALGIGMATGRPAVVVTTSGTATVELHPAVVEAHEAQVPLIVATADRPPELQGVGAPQTIDQAELYGGSVRRFTAPGVPDDESGDRWRPLAGQAVELATGPVPGPVHLNLAFREPLVGTAADLPAVVAANGPQPMPEETESGLGAMLASMPSGTRGVIVAGHGIDDPDEVHRLAERLGWPVIADPRSGARSPRPTTISHADPVLRHGPMAKLFVPELVLRLGDLPASKVVNQWLDAAPARQVHVHGTGKRFDPAGVVGELITEEPASACREVAAAIDPAWEHPDGWLEAWRAADDAAALAIDRVLAGHAESTEPGVARAVLAALPAGGALVASSSMPVRDVEWFGAARERARVLSNRGANGIDGVTSTAVGVAIGSGAPTALLIGDVAFLHDTNGLLGLAHRGVDLTIVVVDNDGGGIFSFLPQRSALPSEKFEHLFGTPHGVDLAALAAAHGLPVASPESAAEAASTIAEALATAGPQLVIVGTERDANVLVHEELNAAVAAALDLLG